VSNQLLAGSACPLIIQCYGRKSRMNRNFDARAVELTRAIAMDGTCLRTKSDADHNLGYELLTRFVRVLVGQLEATRIQLLDLYRAPD
ncbi:MAG TPA: hypothetical protein VMR25_08305, partial [Planctomycetaceae bacterium]|nr:hypothetical protein [Planctomycetaceae bacterium]